MTETLLDVALRGVKSSDEFLAHLREKASDLERGGRSDALDALMKVIRSVEELRDFEAASVIRLTPEVDEG
jgi:predicted butyrate kinase (DUF1464 family)